MVQHLSSYTVRILILTLFIQQLALESVRTEYANAQLECNAADERAKVLAAISGALYFFEFLMLSNMNED